MEERRSLLLDADLELTFASGTSISLHLESGRGVVEMNDTALVRRLIKSSLMSRRNRNTMQDMLSMAAYLKPGIDIMVVGKRIARIDTETGGGFICKLIGMPGLRIWPVGLIRVLFR